MNFKDTLNTLAEANQKGDLSLTLSEALTIANLLSTEDERQYVLDLSTTEALCRFATTLPGVRLAASEGQKIPAIKALRDATKGPGFILPATSNYTGPTGGLGLKDAKDAIELVWATL